jgi:ankyrin repeat protein
VLTQIINSVEDIEKLTLNDVPLSVYAIEYKHWPLFELLIDQGINIEHKNTYGESYVTQLLMSDSDKLNIARILNKLLERKLNINAQDDRGNTALAFAVYLANRDKAYKKVSLLLASGANPNIAAYDGYTPLMDMARAGNKSLVLMLLEYGAKTELQDNRGQTALDYAIQQGDKDIIALLKV